jgi:hypothetical protein
MPSEVVTDQAPTYPVVLEELLPAAWHDTDRHANNRVECDHGRLKARLRPMRGLKQDRSARTVIAGHALIQNLLRGHYELPARSRRTGGWRSHLTSLPRRSATERDCGLGLPQVGRTQHSPAQFPTPEWRVRRPQRQTDAPAGGSGRRART